MSNIWLTVSNNYMFTVSLRNDIRHWKYTFWDGEGFIKKGDKIETRGQSNLYVVQIFMILHEIKIYSWARSIITSYMY